MINKLKKIDWVQVARWVLPYFVILVTTYLMISYQIGHRATFITGDRFLHFNRFFDTSMQIRTGNFSFFQTNFGFNESGRIFNALYGPLFAYINGLFLILCGTWFRYQILVDFAVYLVGGIGMYHLGLKAKVNEYISLMLSVLYLQFGIIVGILRANNFMAWGAALAPFVMMHAVNMVKDKKRPIHWVSLGLIMALVAQIHLLSTIFLAFTLVPFAIYGLVVTANKKEMIINFFKAVGTAIVLTANVWGAFLVVYPGNKISAPNKFNLAAHALGYGKYQFAHGAFSSILILLFVFQLLYIIFHFKDSAFVDIVTLTAWFIFLISSKYMPWNKIQGRFPKLGLTFQFPYRLIIGAIPLILLALGIVLTKIWERNVKVTNEFIAFILMFAIMQTFAGTIRTVARYTNAFKDPTHVITMGNRYKLPKNRKQIQWITRNTNNRELFEDILRGEPDYLPINPSANNLVYRKVILDHQKDYKRRISGDKMILTWTNKKKKKNRLPIVIYKRSRLIVNGKDQTNAPKNTICNPLVTAKKGKNVAVLSYQVPVWYWALLVISILGWLSFLAWWILTWVQKNHGKN